MPKKSFAITHETGLHARPATAVVNKAGQYQSDVQLSYNGKSVNLKSIMGVMSLGVSKGAEVTISAEGNDAESAIEGLAALIDEESIGKPL
ncbi:MAG TPA: phosphocarrier protein HPr [Bacillales bacterium]|nr:phosphocarrier protein HPr [Bacillales bacterium]